MDMTAPSYATMCYWSIEKTCTDIQQTVDNKNIFIVCENPQDVLRRVPFEAAEDIEKIFE